MYKFFTILSGIYVLLVGLLLSGGAVVMFLGGPEDADYPGLAMGTASIFALIGIALMAVAVGVFMRKNWARLNLMIASAFPIVIGSIFCIGIIVMSLVTPALHNARSAQGLIFAAVFYAVFLIVIPVLMLILFNARPVKELYAKKNKDGSPMAEGDDKSGPLGIMIIGAYFLISTLINIISGIFAPPTKEMELITNVLSISGIWIKIYLIVLGIVFCYIGYGFFRLWRSAWNAFMIFQGGSLLLGIWNLANMSQAYLDKILGNLAGYTQYAMTLTQLRLASLFTLVITAAATYYIYRQKKYFIHEFKSGK